MSKLFSSLFLVGLITLCNAQNITNLEYYIDNNDPGIGLATAIPVTPAMDISNQSFAIDLTGLTTGLHTVHLRAEDENGNWSFQNPMQIFTSPTAAQNITELEYYFDGNDPGFGMATAIAITPDLDLLNQVFHVSLIGLTPGLHSIYMRTKTVSGEWSLISRTDFLAIPPQPENVEAFEYYFDGNDPGFGMATAIPLTPGLDLANQVFHISLIGLTPGLHSIYMRSETVSGEWSLISRTDFLAIPPQPENVEAFEYYFDGNDPGFGMATAIPLTPGLDLANQVFHISLIGLTPGLHSIYMRSKTVSGEWSLISRTDFLAIPSPKEDILAFEYFLDGNDPGFGMAAAIPLTPGLDLDNQMLPIDISGLQPGMHTMEVRSKNTSEKWSMTQRIHFVVSPAPAENIMAMEYFIDANDPGIGLATPIPVSAGLNISQAMFNVNLAGVSLGMHTLFIRSQNLDGTWAITSKLHFIRYDEAIANINQFEYFIDTDPGIGNATSINPTAATDINNFMINVDISSFPPGIHDFFIRSLETGHTWSLTNKLNFESTALPVELLLFDAQRNGREVLLSWRTESEVDNDYFDIEHSDDGVRFASIGKVNGAGNSQFINDYNFVHKNPSINLNYYRLKQVDFDGSHDYSPTRVIDIPHSQDDLSIYPVPALDHITAESIQVNEGPYSIEVFDAGGALVKVILGYSAGEAVSARIDISELPSGQYILRLKGYKQLFTQSFVKG